MALVRIEARKSSGRQGRKTSGLTRPTTRVDARTSSQAFLGCYRDDKTPTRRSFYQKGGKSSQCFNAQEAGKLDLADPMTYALNTDKGHIIGAMYNHALSCLPCCGQSQAAARSGLVNP